MEKESFRDFVLDQLEMLEGVDCRAMFGGYGLYCRGVFFGIIARGQLFFKTSEATVSEYREREMKPFRASERQTLKNYYEVPPDVLDDPDELAAWARKAVGSGKVEKGKN